MEINTHPPSDESNRSPASPAPSCLSIKSDSSMYRPIEFGNVDQRSPGTASPAPSCLSMKSDSSMYRPIEFGNGDPRSPATASPAPSCLSMKSDSSMYRPIEFGNGDPSIKQERMSPCLSMKSDNSMDRGLKFGDIPSPATLKQERVLSPCLSMMSDTSIDKETVFAQKSLPSDTTNLTASLLTEDALRCSLCTDVLKDPVSIPCGHSYCSSCITDHWKKTEKTEDYPCPQCRKRFRTRPVLSTNLALNKMIQKLQERQFKVPALPYRCSAGPGDVACDICSEKKKQKAVKSCLTCTVSYCETHVRQHYTVAALQRHTLVEVTGDLEERLCQLHHRALEVFCKTDQMSVCVFCAVKEHAGHEVIKIETDTEQANKTNGDQHIASRLEAVLHTQMEDLRMNNSSTELLCHTTRHCKEWTSDCVVVAALGRPLDLGMLYDWRDDSFCSEACLWDERTIASMRLSLPQPHSEVKCIEGDSIHNRFTALDVSTSLRASVLSGLVEVRGAAGYLKHPPQSKLQDRVTLQYRTSTRLDMLSDSILGEKIPAKQRKATHVVMAVLCGAQALFVFDHRHMSEPRNTDSGDADLSSVIKKMIPSFSANQIFSSLSESEKLKSSLYQCTLHSDVGTLNSVMTFDQAVQVYGTLPQCLGPQGEKAVPMFVWLYPLNLLIPAIEIPKVLSTEVETVLEHLQKVTMRCQDIRTDFRNACVMKGFPGLHKNLLLFEELLQKYHSEIQKELASALQAIKNGEEIDDKGLMIYDKAAFCPQNTHQWLDNKEMEIQAVNICRKNNICILTSHEELEKILNDSQTDRVLCYTLTSMVGDDPYLSALENHIQSSQGNKGIQTGKRYPFKPPSLTRKIQSDLDLFTKYVYGNRNDGEDMKFVIAALLDTSSPGSSIYLYQKGHLVSPNFKIQSIPAPLQVAKRKQDSVTLTFPQSNTENLVQYRIEYRIKNTGVVLADSLPWTTIVVPGSEDTYIVTLLKPFTQYQIRYSVIDESGLSNFSEVIEVKTLLNSPQQLCVHLLGKETVSLSWVQPQAVDGRAPVFQYKVEYKEAGLEGWSTILTEGNECHCDITFLFSTCYRVRVSAVPEDGDTSDPSMETEVPVEVWSIDLLEGKASLLLEALRLQPKNKPVVLRGCSDEESEVQSLLQCLPYISQLSVDPGSCKQSRQISFLLDLFSQAAEWEEQTGEKTLKLLSSVCSYTTFPFRDNDYYDEESICNFLLNLYSSAKRFEIQSGRSVLAALKPVYQSAPAVWSIDLSKRKASLLLEVLKLQPEKKPVELRGWSDKESEVRSFLQCLPYISQLRIKPWSCKQSELNMFLVDLLSQATEWEDRLGEKTLKLLSSVCSYSTFPLRNICDDDVDYKEYQCGFLLDLYSHVKDYETQTGKSILPALKPLYQSAPTVWSIDLSERKVSLLLEVLKLQLKKKPVELRGWSDEESEVRSFLQCLPYISKLSCETGFFQHMCETIPVRSREEAQQLVPLLQALDFTLVLTGELPEETCRSVGRVLEFCASRVELTLTPKISLKGASLLFRHVARLHKLRLNESMAVILSRLAKTGIGAGPVIIDELSLVLKRTWLSEAALSRVVSSVASLLRLWSVQCLDLTEFSIHPHSVITLLSHHGPLTLRLLSETVQLLAVVLFEAQDKELTQSFLEKLGGDLTTCSLDWDILHYLLQQSTQNNPARVDFRKNKLSDRRISDILPFLDRVVIKRPSTSLVMSAIREINESRASDRVSSVLRSVNHILNLNTRVLNAVDCGALCFILQHSHLVHLNLLWTSIPPGEIESILPLMDRVSQLSVDRRLLLRFLNCCTTELSSSSAALSAELLRALHFSLDLSCSSSVNLSVQEQGETLCLSVGDCRNISTVLRDSLLHTLLHTQPQLILKDCEVEDAALRELLPIMDQVKLSTSKALLLQLMEECATGESAPRYAESLCRALGGELDLSETRLDQRVCRSLALVLEHSEGLSELDLSHCHLTDQHLELLLTHLHKVQVLDLSHNVITDALTDRILKLVSENHSIQTVRLFQNKIINREPFLTDKRFEIW